MTTTVRAKMKVTALTTHAWSPLAVSVRLEAQYSPEVPEDQRYAKATPSGHIEMVIDNPPVAEFFKLGRTVYVDFSDAD